MPERSRDVARADETWRLFDEPARGRTESARFDRIPHASNVQRAGSSTYPELFSFLERLPSDRERSKEIRFALHHQFGLSSLLVLVAARTVHDLVELHVAGGS